MLIISDEEQKEIMKLLLKYMILEKLIINKLVKKPEGLSVYSQKPAIVSSPVLVDFGPHLDTHFL
jgi:hypothetical protein